MFNRRSKTAVSIGNGELLSVKDEPLGTLCINLYIYRLSRNGWVSQRFDEAL